MKTNHSIFSVVLSVFVLFCAGFGIGIGIGAGIWKGSGSNEIPLKPDAEWFYAQGAQQVFLVKDGTNSSDDVSLFLAGLSPVTVGLTDTPRMGNMYISNERMTQLIRNDPGKNAMLVCGVGDENLALPVTLNGGFYNSSYGMALYTATYIDFDASAWKHLTYINESAQMNVSRHLQKEDDYLEYESCYLFIDGLLDFFDSKSKTAGFVNGVLGGVAGGGATNILAQESKAIIDPSEENVNNLKDYVDGSAQGAVVDAGVAGAAYTVGPSVVAGINDVTATKAIQVVTDEGKQAWVRFGETGILGGLAPANPLYASLYG